MFTRYLEFNPTRKKDNLIVIDDSIVRGTTLKQSILSIINRLEPKKIVVVSSSPQVRYPDYYGIDMSKNEPEFCAFRAAIALLKESGRQQLIDEVYQECKSQENEVKENSKLCNKNLRTVYSGRNFTKNSRNPDSRRCGMSCGSCFFKLLKVCTQLVRTIQATGILQVIIPHRVGKDLLITHLLIITKEKKNNDRNNSCH